MTVKRKFSPVRHDNKLEYTITGDVINVIHYEVKAPIVAEDGTVTHSEPVITTDSFDLSGLPDGEADVTTVETTLPINPFISIKRANGVLEVEVINYHGANATEAERFPEWEVIG